ncbi:MAG: hypothetical protein KBD29_02850 [Candidatus Magasanikbacteria bacterium]|nr:hypothetical protein [Candidatus Magasanikbacteria bacterium]
MSKKSKRQKKTKLTPPTEYLCHEVVVHRDPSRKRPKEVHTGSARVTQFTQTIVVHYNGRTNCLDVNNWKKELQGNRLTLEATVEQQLHKPVRLDFFINGVDAS